MKEKLKEARQTRQQTNQPEAPVTGTQQAYEELQRKTEDLTLVNLLNDTINQGGSLQEAIKLLSQETKRLFSSYGATVYLLSEDREYLVTQNLGLPPRLVNTIEKLIGIKIPPLRVKLQGASLYSEKLKNRKPLLINDPETIQRYMYEFTDDKRLQKLIPTVHKILGIHSLMGIPLISDGQVFGLIEISRNKPFTESDLQRLATIAGQITNIIKRKQAEEALKKSEEKFAKAFHSSPNASSIATLEVSRCLDINESFTTFTGYGRDEIIGGSVSATDLWVESADRTRLVQMLQEQGKVRDLEAKIRAKSGDIKLGLISAELIDISGETCILVTGQDITERKRTQEKLVESEEKYRELAESITDVFFAMDKQLRYTYWNRASEELTGISAENALGKHLRDVFSDSEQTRKVEEIYLNVLRTKKPESFVQKYQIGDKKFSFEINAYPTRNGLSVFAKDITERKQAEEALRESEERLRAFGNALPDVAFILDEEGRHREFFTNDENLLYQEADRVIGRTLHDILPKEVADKELAVLRKALETGRTQAIEYELNGSLGPRLFEGLISPMSTPASVPRMVAMVARDVTERKRAEKALQESEEKLRQMFKSMSDGLVVADLDGTITEVNDRFLEMHGFGSKDEVIGKHGSELSAPFELDRIAEDYKKIVKGAVIRNIESTLPRTDGSTFPAELSMSLLRDAYGKPTGFITLGRDITERKQAEGKHQAIIKTALDGFCLGDLEGRFFEVNDSYCQMTGYSREELLKMTIADIETSETPEEMAQRLQSVKQRSYDLFESKLRCKDGKTIDVEISMNYLDVDNEQVCVFIRDITERKQAEAALRESEEKLRQMFSSVSDGLIVTDLDGTITEVNDRFLEMHRYGSRDEVIGKHGFELSATFKRDRVTEMEQKTLKEGSVKNIEATLPRTDGSTFSAELSMSLLRDASGKPSGFITIGRDITKRKQAEEMFRVLANSSPIGIYIVQDGKFQFTNPQFQRLVGKSEEELVGSDSLNFVAAEDRENVRRKAVRMLKGELSQPYEYRSFNGRGEIRWVLETVTSIEYRGKRAVVGNHMDITERKMLQQEQQRLGRLESIGTLAGGIAHDFNNILTGIMGNISLALRNIEPNSKVAERLLEAEKASLRAKDLTHRLLTFARGGAPIKKTVSIANLIRESADFALRGSNTRCQYSLPEELWPLEADEGQLNQVFTNLVINASEAMPEGGTLHIRARNTVNKRKGPLPRGNYVEITVKDHGTGIASGHLERIFEPYFTTKQKGSGLGLAISYSIIKNHDGHVGVRSEPGKGTTFTIYLPAGGKPAPAVKKKPAVQAPTPGKGRILVMDDEPTIRALLNRMLTGRGYEVELTTDGKEAIEKYAEARKDGKPFDAVIMDLTIPGGMGGKETISHLLKIDPNANAIVSSGYSTDPIMADYQKYGFRGVVAKPYVAADLEKALRNTILGLNE